MLENPGNLNPSWRFQKGSDKIRLTIDQITGSPLFIFRLCLPEIIFNFFKASGSYQEIA
jgi:hypothetical protein